MSSFKEFLEDYEAKEIDNVKDFYKNLKENKITSDVDYPSRDRFIKIKDPIARPTVCPIWGIIPFHGSTIVPLFPATNEEMFDKRHDFFKFSSKDIGRMIDFVKDTGRLQFTLGHLPTNYENLNFLEPLFYELKPPLVGMSLLEPLLTDEERKIGRIEFFTLAEFGFDKVVYSMKKLREPERARIELTRELKLYLHDYTALKKLGYDELVKDIEYYMVIDPFYAYRLYSIVVKLIIIPQFAPQKAIETYNKHDLSEIKEFEKNYGFITDDKILYDIGKFILNKIVYYPETYDGCLELLQYYDDNELYKVLNAVNEGIKNKNIDIIEDKKDNFSVILDNIWNDAN